MVRSVFTSQGIYAGHVWGSFCDECWHGKVSGSRDIIGPFHDKGKVEQAILDGWAKRVAAARETYAKRPVQLSLGL